MVISRGGYILRARSVLSVSAGLEESVTVTATVKSPDAVGVPEMTTAAEQVKRAGNPVASQV